MLLLGGEMLELSVNEGNIWDNVEFKKNAINLL